MPRRLPLRQSRQIHENIVARAEPYRESLAIALAIAIEKRLYGPRHGAASQRRRPAHRSRSAPKDRPFGLRRDQRAEEGLGRGTLPNDSETGAPDDKDLLTWHDYRSRENDRLSHEWACHEGTLDDNAVHEERPLREEGALHEERPLCDDDALREEGPLLHEEGPLPEKRSALESETAARDDLPMPSSEPGARDDLAMPSREGA